MTDIPSQLHSVPSRLGTSAHYEDGVFTMSLEPTPEVLHHGIVRASAIAFLIDALAGISLDQDRSAWTLTTDLSMRMRPVPAPARLLATNTIVRQGRRSATSTVDVMDDAGTLVATAAIGFAKVLRKEGDPPKPTVSFEDAARIFTDRPTLDDPVRQAAGVRTIDAAAGIVEVDVTPSLQNPAGTLQGAMVALVAECAAEDLATERSGHPHVVTDLDLRYLTKTAAGPVRTSSRLLGEDAGAPVEVLLTDRSLGLTTTHVFARAVPVPEP